MSGNQLSGCVLRLRATVLLAAACYLPPPHRLLRTQATRAKARNPLPGCVPRSRPISGAENRRQFQTGAPADGRESEERADQRLFCRRLHHTPLAGHGLSPIRGELEREFLWLECRRLWLGGRHHPKHPVANAARRIGRVDPKVIVLLAGTNNMGSTPASDAKISDITKGIKALLDVMREKAPKATIIVMGILPRNDGADPTAVMPSINRINENIAKFADGKTIRYLNINDKLADKDGRLIQGMSVDRLHLTAKGYQVWADALKPLFVELLGPAAKEDHAPPPTGDPSAAAKKVSTKGPAKP